MVDALRFFITVLATPPRVRTTISGRHERYHTSQRGAKVTAVGSGDAIGFLENLGEVNNEFTGRSPTCRRSRLRWRRSAIMSAFTGQTHVPPPSFNPCAIVPVFDHEHAVARVVAAVRAAGLPCLLVDDGSGPVCARELDRLAATVPHTSVLRLPVNGGKGAAMLAGFAARLAARLQPCPADRCGRAACPRGYPDLHRGSAPPAAGADLRAAGVRSQHAGGAAATAAT